MIMSLECVFSTLSVDINTTMIILAVPFSIKEVDSLVRVQPIILERKFQSLF